MLRQRHQRQSDHNDQIEVQPLLQQQEHGEENNDEYNDNDEDYDDEDN